MVGRANERCGARGRGTPRPTRRCSVIFNGQLGRSGSCLTHTPTFHRASRSRKPKKAVGPRVWPDRCEQRFIQKKLNEKFKNSKYSSANKNVFKFKRVALRGD